MSALRHRSGQCLHQHGHKHCNIASALFLREWEESNTGSDLEAACVRTVVIYKRYFVVTHEPERIECQRRLAAQYKTSVWREKYGSYILEFELAKRGPNRSVLQDSLHDLSDLPASY